MALLFADGFEHYGTSTIGRDNMLAGVYLFNGSLPTTEQARTGERSLRATTTYASSSRAIKGLLTDSNHFGVAFATYATGLPGSHGIRIGTGAGTTTDLWFLAQATGGIIIREGTASAGTIIGQTAAGILTAQAWHHWEIRILQDNVVGEIEIRINGVVELLLTNLALSSTPYDTVTLSSNSSNNYYDDFIIWDDTGSVNNTFFGPARVNTVFMAEDDSGVAAWSINGASDGADALRETQPDGDTSYVSAANVGMRSRFIPQELPPEVEAIAGIYVSPMGKLASAGEGHFQVAIVSVDETAAGPDQPLTSAYVYWGTAFQVDPKTGSPFTRQGFHDLLFQLEKTL